MAATFSRPAVPCDRFLRRICKSNPIRGNLVASTLRELATHVLHSLRIVAHFMLGFLLDSLPTMHATVTELAGGKVTEEEPAGDETSPKQFTPALSVRKSLASKDHIISMINGKPYKTLRRHLSTNGLTPEEYRRRYNLKPDYPMVAENYSAARREMAKTIGLGSRGRQAKAASGATAKPRRRKAAAPEGS